MMQQVIPKELQTATIMSMTVQPLRRSKMIDATQENKTHGPDVKADNVLQTAINEGLQNVIVIGWNADGDFYFSSSYSDGPETLWLLAQAQRQLLQAGEE